MTKLGLVEVSEDGGVAVTPESTPLPPHHTPVISHKGTVTCQTQEGDIACFVAAPYEHANAGSRAPGDVRRRYEALKYSTGCLLRNGRFEVQTEIYMKIRNSRVIILKLVWDAPLLEYEH